MLIKRSIKINFYNIINRWFPHKSFSLLPILQYLTHLRYF
ncbi:hypothetical protein CXB51_018987 [Gossypium anomalum]|uniref:Uncharacterized protein n=1 Tax=Gossypium anomalum TaxID=47600 RepID=A0A8J6CSB2_9ROSI|nr:hypothetical protein CXB51_018987 [Gossypium anomalum]